MYSGMMNHLDYYLLQKPIHPCKMLSSGPVNGSFFEVTRGFIQSVNTMESTVLVPTLLKDINLEGVSWVPSLMVKCNYRQLFEIYCAIKKCKNYFTEVEIDEVDKMTSNRRSIKTNNNLTDDKTTTTTTIDENPLLVYAIESGIGYLSPDYVINYCQQLDQSKVPDVPSPSPSTTTLSSSSNANSTGSNRKQKISLDSGNWSSRGSDSVDDDFDFDSTGNAINGSTVTPSPSSTTATGTTANGNLINCLINSQVNHHDEMTNNLHSESDQQQPLTTLLNATSTYLRNLKALFNHLKEVADFVTQQYLQALQLI
ncbi:uncharacterized protein LOC128386344 [Panonychus citri]|uniref:uncharacterized protein LOC128386344 n=1 Tax=Panonychus citri TaxID=50023 RepID=UPI0023080346|nr:uncharacterized protein LOC128386344 [Panonychus citri]